MKRLNVLVVGTGMYVCGRGTDSSGTIMPAVLESAKLGRIGKIYVAGRSRGGVKEAGKKIRSTSKAMGVGVQISYYSDSGDGVKGYIKAMKQVPKPACAIIAVPDRFHKEIASAAISSGLHTLVVKPFVTAAADAEALEKMRKGKGLYGAVEFHKRFDSANLKLKESIESGDIGDPLYFAVEFSQRKSIPSKVFRNWVETTNIFQYLGIHYADMVYFVTGAVPKRAMAVGQRNWLKSKGIDAFDAVEAMIEWRLPGGKKFVSSILTNWVDPESSSAMSDQKIKVIGTKGRFESDQKDRGITVVTDSGGICQPNPYFCSAYRSGAGVSYKGYGIDSITTFLGDVLDIEEGRRDVLWFEGKRPTFKDSITSTKILEAVNKSLKSDGKWVEIK
jgi:predicted dehydrogenase